MISLTGAISHTGWKSIAKRFGVRDTRTARKWVRLYSIPVIKMGTLVTLDEDIYRAWLLENLKIRKGNIDAISEGDHDD